ncbi:MAG: hypothetical protein IKZ09_05415, partial [Clostridia bacterium]|nr:hypothetical protein [Clostridia bacterium]
RVEFAENGSFSVTDLATGRILGLCNIFEDVKDGGNTYNFEPVEGDVALLTDNAKAEYSVSVGAYGITVTADIKTERCDISAAVTLIEGADRVDVKTTVDNFGEDHRVRALFYNDIDTDVVYAAGQFDIVERNIKPAETWINPFNTQRAEQFVMLNDARGGFVCAHRGLNEYEILQDGRNTMALTLLRSVGEIGDWGDFPTPKAQCIGKYCLEYALIPFAEETREAAVSSAYVYASNALSAVDTDRHAGTMSAQNTFITLSDPMLRHAALKCAEDGEGLVLRLYNVDDKARTASVRVADAVKAVYASELDERKGDAIALNGGEFTVTVPAKKIVTFRLI